VDGGQVAIVESGAEAPGAEESGAEESGAEESGAEAGDDTSSRDAQH
jgi:hypothetical protein